MTFRKKIADDINNIKSSENLLTFADKITNLYEITPEQYKTILTNNVKNKTLHLEKIMEGYVERPAFISLKDHKMPSYYFLQR